MNRRRREHRDHRLEADAADGGTVAAASDLLELPMNIEILDESTPKEYVQRHAPVAGEAVSSLATIIRAATKRSLIEDVLYLAMTLAIAEFDRHHQRVEEQERLTKIALSRRATLTEGLWK